jgi:hypothetical protein
MRAVNYKTASFFPTGLAFSAAVIVPFSVVVAFVDYRIGLPVLLVSLVAATTHYRLSVNPEEKKYSEYVWLLGLRLGKSDGSFDTIEYLFIKSSRESQTMNSRVISDTIHKTVFVGYVKFSEEDKVHIATRDTREGLLKVLSPISSALNTPIMDYTQPVQG